MFRRTFPLSSPTGPLLPRFSDEVPLSERSRDSSSPSRSRPSSSPANSSTRRSAPKVSFAKSIQVDHNDPLIYLNRAAKQLQENIQNLLDAQSEGLLAGLGSNQSDDLASTGSLTPRTGTPTQSVAGRTNQDIASSTWSAKPKKTIPVRQPAKKVVTLRDARRGLSKSMQEFASLKAEELQILDSKLQERTNLLESLDSYDSKEATLQQEISSIESSDENASIQTLRSQDQTLEQEIQDLELKLQELRNRHHYLQTTIRERESTLQSKLSSYQGSLALHRSNTANFLRRPPPPPPLPTTTQNPANESSFYALNPKRRTTQLARECWSEEASQIQTRKDDVHSEQTALNEGQKLWQQATQELTAFEKSLQAKMSPASTSHSPQQQGADRETEVRDVLGDMDAMIDNLSSRLQHAESRKWNLLVCALGAELEAFKEGKAMLMDAAGMTQVEEEVGNVNGKGEEDLLAEEHREDERVREQGGSDGDGSDRGGGGGGGKGGNNEQKPFIDPVDPLQGTVEDDSTHQPSEPRAQKVSNRVTPTITTNVSESSEDDEPGPEFLISHTD
ncbi:MAG: hypothetical protein Q9227_000828 [Pyrenula ochraceoflavens]